MTEIAKALLICGAILISVGVVFFLGSKFFGLGKLPGDIYIKKENFTFYFPIITCLIISLVLTLVFYLLRK